MTTHPALSAPSPAPALSARGLQAGYRDRLVLDGVDLDVRTGEHLVVIGPNASGKSTLLRALAGALRLRAGHVEIGGEPLADLPPRQLARRLGLLPQTPSAPDDLVVEDLVARGRYPHQGLLKQWSPDDEAAVDEALRRAGVEDFRDRLVDELSGGQRQRVWIALAQQTPVLLLDEPTTFLDVAHQIEVLRLCRDLVADGITLVTVLHDLNLAARFADRMAVMKDGRLVALGEPGEVLTAQLLADVFDLPSDVHGDPASGRPFVVPRIDP